MSKTTPSVEALAARILTLAKSRKIPLPVLAESAGIAPSTLRNHLLYNPARLTATDLFQIASALNVSPASLVIEGS